MWAALNSSDCCLFLKNKIIHALQAAVGAVASYIRTHISLHWHCISCDESRGVLAIWHPIEILSLKNYTIIDLGSIGYFTEHWYRLYIQLKLSYWNYIGIDFHTRIYSTSIGFAPLCGDASAWAPNASTCQQNRPQPNATKSEASELNQSKPNQGEPNSGSHNNLHIDTRRSEPDSESDFVSLSPQQQRLCWRRRRSWRRAVWLPKQLKAKLFITISARKAKKKKKKEI